MQHRLTFRPRHAARLVLRGFCLFIILFSAQVHAATFNVTTYGAVGDDSTDNTAAFTACLNAVIAAGGGKMYLPDGVYRGRIAIPAVSLPSPSWIAIEIVGESEPPPVWGTVGNFPLQNKGTIVKSLATSGSAVISANPSPNSIYNTIATGYVFSAVHVIIRNLDVRTYNNPQIGGIDLSNAMQCRLENVFINTGVYNVQASQPTYSTKGLNTPANDNAALTILRNVGVTGYQTGIVVHEHTDGDNIILGSNIHGLEFATASHASRFGRVCAQRCTYPVTVTGNHGFLIEQLDIEKAGPGQTDANNAWQATADDLNDPNNFGKGDIEYWVVVGNVGAVDQFTRNGGASVQTRRVGAAGVANSVIPNNGSFEDPDMGSMGYVEIPVGATIGGWKHQSGSLSAWILDEQLDPNQFPTARDGTQMLEFDHRSNPRSQIHQSLGTTQLAGAVTASAFFALRDFNVGPPVPGAVFRLLLLSGTPGNFTTLANSGPLTHSAAKTWVRYSVTAPSVPAGTEVFVGIEADFWGTPSNHVFTVVDEMRSSFPFAITSFNYNEFTSSISLTWNSRPDRSYRVAYSLALENWVNELASGLGPMQDENPADGAFISTTFNLGTYDLQNEPQLFFRVEEE